MGRLFYERMPHMTDKIEDKKPVDTSPVTVSLFTPIGEMKTITFNEAKMKDMIKAENVGSNMQTTAQLWSYMSGVDYEILIEIGAADVSQIMDKVEHLMGN